MQSSLWFVPAQTIFGVLVDVAEATEEKALAFRRHVLAVQAANAREKLDEAELV